MPEEINRIVTDAVADILFTTERSAHENLAAEGIPAERIHFVGNVMIDGLTYALEKARGSQIPRTWIWIGTDTPF
ncbi:MAG TPA: UDP-N-acetylglucosamine 2-epimerase [Terriglobales bacterium]|nr:UDP-N-acetylglucosamine 2-epimerase [Terriglobales bacterium]